MFQDGAADGLEIRPSVQVEHSISFPLQQLEQGEVERVPLPQYDDAGDSLADEEAVHLDAHVGAAFAFPAGLYDPVSRYVQLQQVEKGVDQFGDGAARDDVQVNGRRHDRR